MRLLCIMLCLLASIARADVAAPTIMSCVEMAQICDEIISMGADHQAFISAASRLKVDEVIGRRSEYDVIVIGPCLAPDFRFYLLLRRVTKGYIL